MSRVIFFIAVVALVVCCASSVSARAAHSCSDGMVWEQCPSVCSTTCENALPAGIDCGVIDCHGKCVCKPGYFLSKDGFCIFPNMC